ncbi:MAG: hypothetical protein JXA49_09070 [Actinobacteria bacterium]|nr:hypothetical protein [Actinomycetota bacterium]
MERKKKPKNKNRIKGISSGKGRNRSRRTRPGRRDSETVLGGLDYDIDLSAELEPGPGDHDEEFERDVLGSRTDESLIPSGLEMEDEKETGITGEAGTVFEDGGIEETEAEPPEDGKSKISERRATARVKRPREKSRFPAGPVTLAVLAAVTLLVAVLTTPFTAVDFSNLGFFLVLFTLAAHLDILVGGGGKVNVGVAVIIAAFLSLPRVEVVWIFLIGTLVTLFTVHMGRWTKEILLGMLCDFVAIGAASGVYALLMRILPDKPQLFGRYTPWELIAVVLIGALLFMMFLAREAYVFSNEGKLPFAIYMRSAFRQSWIAYSMLVITGLLMGMVFRGIGMWSVLIAVPLLLLFVYTFNRVARTDQYLSETVRVLSRIPEEIGVVPKGYIEDVALITGEVARELGLAPEDVQQVEYAAYLHGIGAVAVNPEEMSHGTSEADEAVLAGSVDILGRMEYLDVAAEILRGREGVSERVPDMQKRRAISVGGGILSAVEDFVKLLRGSEDREPLGYNEAITEMNLERGSRYDSKVLRAIARIAALPKEESFLADVEGRTESPSLRRR